MSCCAPCPGSARCSQLLYLHNCLNWECSIESRSPRWPGWHHLTVIVEHCTAAVASGADVPKSGASYIWQRWLESAAIPPSELSICGCVPTVNTPSPRSSPVCASSSLFSMPCFTTKLTGKHLRSLPLLLPFLPFRARFPNTVAARVNGPDYIHPEVYHPERLLSMNQSGQLLSVVAVHAGNDVVGHAALERPDPEPYAESGEAMVLLEHRHHHLLDRMKEMLDVQGREIGLTGIFGNAVTHHIFSQLTEERAKAQPTAILLGSSPAAAHQLKDFPQRVSLITYFKYTSVPGPARLHLPRRHRPLAERIFRA